MYSATKQFLLFLLIAFVVVTVKADEGVSGIIQKKPNFLFITVDTLRADHLSCYGYYLKTSPNIDKLAQNGVLFENCTSNIPLTGPAHCTMLTSLYPHEHGAIRNGVPMNSDALSVVSLLKESGYNTAAFVSSWTLKAHLTGVYKGFDIYDDNVDQQYSVINNERTADNTARLALDWLEKAGKEPFFLWVHLFDPHDPYMEHKEFKKMERNDDANALLGQVVHLNQLKQKRYDQEIAFADKHLGMIFKKLEDRGLSENTVIILTADHGESFGEHNYSGHGRQVYEAGIHIPLIISGKDFGRGVRYQNSVQQLDIAPTICSLAGINIPDSFRGADISPLLKGGGTLGERDIYFMTYPGAVGHLPKWLKSLIVSDKPSQPLKLGVKRIDTEKFILSPDQKKLEIYNLATDRYEANSRYFKKSEYKKVRAELLEWFMKSRKETGKSKVEKEDMEKLKSLGYIN